VEVDGGPVGHQGTGPGVALPAHEVHHRLGAPPALALVGYGPPAARAVKQAEVSGDIGPAILTQ
nr:hypothetical protein [Tanacetum cinerariifolium]